MLYQSKCHTLVQLNQWKPLWLLWFVQHPVQWMCFGYGSPSMTWREEHLASRISNGFSRRFAEKFSSIQTEADLSTQRKAPGILEALVLQWDWVLNRSFLGHTADFHRIIEWLRCLKMPFTCLSLSANLKWFYFHGYLGTCVVGSLRFD